MSILRPAEFGGKFGWEILSDIARSYASQDIKVARVLIMVTKYLKILEESPTISVEGKLEALKVELTDLVEMLGTGVDPATVTELQEALKDAEAGKLAIFEEFSGDAQALKDATEELATFTQDKGSYQSYVAELEGKVADLQDAVSGAQECWSEDTSELTVKIAKLEKKLAEKSEQVDDRNSEIQTWKDGHTTLTATIGTLRNKLEGTPTKRETYTETVRLLQVELADLAGEKSQMQVKLDKRAAKYSELLAAYRKLKNA